MSGRKTHALLMVLADFLDELPGDRFDYGVWGRNEETGDLDLDSCGTVRCAAGWAGTLPEFKVAGLSLWNGTPAYELGRSGSVCFGVYAMARVLGISYEDASYLFCPDNELNSQRSPAEDASASDVAAHIRWYLKENPIV